MKTGYALTPLRVAFFVLCALLLSAACVVLLFPGMGEALVNLAASRMTRPLTPAEREAIPRLASRAAAAGVLAALSLALLLRWETGILAWARRRPFALAAAVMSVLALLVRLPGLPLRSTDYEVFIQPWLEHLRGQGRLFGIGSIISDYTPFYLYLLSLVSLLPEALWLAGVKTVSIAADAVCAVLAARIVRERSGSKVAQLAAYTAVLFCPTMLLNSSVWGQCDSVYAAFTLGSFLLFLKKERRAALFVFGVALSIKTQAVFFLPLLVFLYVLDQWRLEESLFVVAGWAAAMIPAVLTGGASQIARAYYAQLTAYGSRLTWNAPSVYALFDVAPWAVHLLTSAGILLTLSLFAAAAFRLFIGANTDCSPRCLTGGGEVALITCFSCSSLSLPRRSFFQRCTNAISTWPNLPSSSTPS